MQREGTAEGTLEGVVVHVEAEEHDTAEPVCPRPVGLVINAQFIFETNPIVPIEGVRHHGLSVEYLWGREMERTGDK